jgi:hypothetical protein
MIGVPSMIVTASLPRPSRAGLDEWLRADKTIHPPRPPAAGPSGSRADVWPHKGAHGPSAVLWPAKLASRDVRPHVGRSGPDAPRAAGPLNAGKRGTCNPSPWSYHVRPPRVGQRQPTSDLMK